MSDAPYRGLLGDADLDLLRTLATDEGDIGTLIARKEVYERLFASPERERFVLASPFLAFAVLLAHAGEELEGATFVGEWVGPRERVPVFDVELLRAFIRADSRRLFLAKLLASYSHLSGGSVWVRRERSRGWQRRRYSELDPLRLAELL